MDIETDSLQMIQQKVRNSLMSNGNKKERKKGKKMKDEAISLGADFRKCIEFHGHACLGLFKIEKITPEIPVKARIMDSGICDFCRESTKVDLLRTIDGKKVCIPCAEKHGFDNDLFSLPG